MIHTHHRSLSIPKLTMTILIAMIGFVQAQVQGDTKLLDEKPPNVREKKIYNEMMNMPSGDLALKKLDAATKDESFWAWLQANPKLQQALVTHVTDKDAGTRIAHKKVIAEKIMKDTQLKYVVDEDGDAKVSFDYTKEGRGQTVWITSEVKPIGNYNIRNVFSYAYIGAKTPDASAMEEALTKNNSMDTSRWSLAYSEKNKEWTIKITAVVPDIADGPTLAALIRGIGARADEFEKAHFKTDKY